jgi:hypothetical protein
MIYFQVFRCSRNEIYEDFVSFLIHNDNFWGELVSEEDAIAFVENYFKENEFIYVFEKGAGEIERGQSIESDLADQNVYQNKLFLISVPKTNPINSLMIGEVAVVGHNPSLIVADNNGNILSSDLEYAEFCSNGVVALLELGKEYYQFSRLHDGYLQTFNTNFSFNDSNSILELDVIYFSFDYFDGSQLRCPSLEMHLIELESNSLNVDNEDDAIALISTSFGNYCSLPRSLQLNENVALHFIFSFEFGFHYLLPELMGSELIARNQINTGIVDLSFFSPGIQSNRSIVEVAVREVARNIKYASEELQNDRSFIELIVAENSCSLEYLLPIWQDDTNIVRSCVERDGLLLQYTSERLSRDEEIVGIAVTENPSAEKYDLRIEREENDDELPF